MFLAADLWSLKCLPFSRNSIFRPCQSRKCQLRSLTSKDAGIGGFRRHGWRKRCQSGDKSWGKYKLMRRANRRLQRPRCCHESCVSRWDYSGALVSESREQSLNGEKIGQESVFHAIFPFLAEIRIGRRNWTALGRVALKNREHMRFSCWETRTTLRSEFQVIRCEIFRLLRPNLELGFKLKSTKGGEELYVHSKLFLRTTEVGLIHE